MDRVLNVVNPHTLRYCGRGIMPSGEAAPLGFSDRALIEQILDKAKPSHYGIRNFIHEVVQSTLFREKCFVW